MIDSSHRSDRYAVLLRRGLWPQKPGNLQHSGVLEACFQGFTKFCFWSSETLEIYVIFWLVHKKGFFKFDKKKLINFHTWLFYLSRDPALYESILAAGRTHPTLGASQEHWPGWKCSAKPVLIVLFKTCFFPKRGTWVVTKTYRVNNVKFGDVVPQEPVFLTSN